MLTADDLIASYRAGVFPMSEGRDDPDLHLVDPHFRGVFPLEGFKVPRRLARTVRHDPYEVRVDTVFAQTVQACAAPTPDRPDTWINPAIETLYAELFARGVAHSVECWLGERLVGGLYGVALDGAFFGESMFSRATDASKIALVHLVARLKAGGYRLLDTQFQTPHLETLGAVEITRAEYRRRLADALAVQGDFYRMAPQVPGDEVLHAISQRS